MPEHCEQKLLPYRSDQIFDLVADIASYPQFLPWCTGARIRSRQGHVVLADLIVGFKMVRERFTSRVTLSPPDQPGGVAAIHVEYIDGPLKSLSNEWHFSPGGDGGSCVVDFLVRFEFRSRVMKTLASLFFSEVVSRMVSAFEHRAREIYGQPVIGTSSDATTSQA